MIYRLRKNLTRLRWLGWTWKEISLICNKSITWAYLTAKGLHAPPEHVLEEVTERVEEEMRKLPRHLWETSEELEQQILHEIQTNHVGLRNAIKIPLLAKIVGCSERKARASISSLRDKGYPICTSIGDPPGAFWPETDKEFWEFIHRDFRPRWKSMKNTEDAMIEGYARLKRGEPIEVQLQPELILQQQDAG